MPMEKPTPETGEDLIEVFDGVVNPRQLLWTTLATSISGIVMFNIASHFFNRIAEPEIAGGYALLVGLLACVGCAAASTRFVAPKRVMTQDTLDDLSLAETMSEVQFVAGGTLDIETASPQAAAEMRSTGIDVLFAEAVGKQVAEPLRDSDEVTA